MTKANTQVIAKVAAVVAGIGLVLSSFALAIPASAQTTTFTRDLTIGATGADVTALQTWLIGKGYSIPAGATGYFGTQTQAATAAYQLANNITPPAGYFGPITRAHVNAGGGASTGGSTVPGCSAGYKFSSTTGASCDDGDTDTDTDTGALEGGAGSVESYTLISSLNNEEVGEDEEDADVAGIEVEVDDGSDLEFTAIRLVFDEGTAGSDFEDYAAEVAIMLDGDEVARVDADEFNDDNNWTKTVSLEDAIIRAGDTGEFTVAITGASVIDSADIDDTWTVDFRQVRFVDADGASISEDPTVNPRTFSFASFATASDAELKIAEDDADINDARTIEVSDTSDTDNVDVLSFTLEAEGDSDLEIKNWGVSVTTSEGNTDDVISNLSLWIDGDEIVSADTVSGAGATEFYNFDDVDYTIDAGDTVEVVLKADFNDIQATSFDEGTTISFALGEEQTDVAATVDVEDESGEQLADADITGSVDSGDFELRSTGIMVTFITASETLAASDVSGNNDSGTFVIKYNVEAFGDTVYVSDSSTATIAASIPDSTVTTGVLYLVDQAGTATTADLSALVTFSTSGGASDTGVTNGVALADGEDANFTLTVTRTNNADADDDGLFRVLLKAVTWATTDSATQNVYDFNLEDFKTDPISIN